MDERLIEAGVELGDWMAIRTRLQHLGYRARLGLYGPHDRIKIECAQGGRGISCTHVFEATPMEAIRDGCPHCALDHFIKNGPPPEITEAEMASAIKAQHKRIAKAQLKGRQAMNRRSSRYGLPRHIGSKF